MRRLIAFPCAGETLAGTLDEAPGATGLLIVSGGNEIRIGAHRGMALLAARLAGAGVPVLRFDRRGIGDSTGENRGFESSGPDIAAAAAALRREQPQITRLFGLGNCDAAAALTLFYREAMLDGLILTNPWIADEADALPPAAAIRAHYAERLRDPATWLRALRGGVSLTGLTNGLRKLASALSQANPALGEALATTPPTTLILARRDNTALAFADAWKGPAFATARERITPVFIDTASHSFARPGDAEALERALLAALA